MKNQHRSMLRSSEGIFFQGSCFSNCGTVSSPNVLRLQKYEVNITYVPGKHMHVADTLSRAYLNEQPTDADLTNDMEVHSLIANLPMTQEKLAQL